VAIDGEGITIGRNHYYNVITARCRDLDKTIIFPAMEGVSRLTTWDILDFLTKRLSIFRHQKAIFVAFSFDYDVTKWLQDLTHEELSELYHTTEVHVVSPKGIAYTIRYFRRKFFTLEFIYKDKNGALRTTGITIYDVFSFFGCSFVKALENWSIPVPDFLVKMKDARGNFAHIDQQTIFDYNATECDLLCELMDKVREALNAEGIPLSKWHGSGAIAQKVLEIARAKEKIAIPQIRENADLHDALYGSYFGGRFELFRKGIVNQTFQYDINSAYPFAMSLLPDLSNCTIDYSTTYTNDYYSIWFVTYNVLDHGTKKKQYKYNGAESFLCGPFPYRTKQGNIFYPYWNQYGIWVHQCELQNAIRLYGREHFKIQHGFILKPKSNRPAFPFISEIAARRLELKEIGDERNIVLKLALNSLYGKTAQGQREIGVIPPFQNYYIAGFITAFTRAKLLAQSFQDGRFGSSAIQFATDGIFAISPANNIRHTNTDFGGWEYTHIPVPICYIQGGIYYAQNKVSGKDKRRTRGFNANALESVDVFHAWRQFYNSGGITESGISANESRFFGIGTTLATGNWSRFGRFIGVERRLSFFTPSKQFANAGGELLTREYEWKYLAPRIRGLSKSEMMRDREYVLQVPNSDWVERESRLYEPINLKDPSLVPEGILDMIIESIQSGEQPDYYENEILEIEI
jgi:hypothetical protein